MSKYQPDINLKIADLLGRHEALIATISGVIQCSRMTETRTNFSLMDAKWPVPKGETGFAIAFLDDLRKETYEETLLYVKEGYKRWFYYNEDHLMAIPIAQGIGACYRVIATFAHNLKELIESVKSKPTLHEELRILIKLETEVFNKYSGYDLIVELSEDIHRSLYPCYEKLISVSNKENEERKDAIDEVLKIIIKKPRKSVRRIKRSEPVAVNTPDNQRVTRSKQKQIDREENGATKKRLKK